MLHLILDYISEATNVNLIYQIIKLNYIIEP